MKVITLQQLINQSQSQNQKRANAVCTLCNVNFKNRKHLYRHNREKHSQDPQQFFACPYQNCDKKFKRNSHVKRHLISHTRERNFKCDECIMTFGHKHHLDRHIKIKHLSQLPTCEHCKMEFSKKKQLAKHLFKVHNQGSQQSTKKKQSKKIKKNKFKRTSIQKKKQRKQAQQKNVGENPQINKQSEIEQQQHIFQDSLDQFQSQSIYQQISQQQEQQQVQNNAVQLNTAKSQPKTQISIILYKCPYQGCINSFTKKCSLKRHLLNKHEISLNCLAKDSQQLKL